MEHVGDTRNMVCKSKRLLLFTPGFAHQCAPNSIQTFKDVLLHAYNC